MTHLGRLGCAAAPDWFDERRRGRLSQGPNARPRRSLQRDFRREPDGHYAADVASDEFLVDAQDFALDLDRLVVAALDHDRDPIADGEGALELGGRDKRPQPAEVLDLAAQGAPRGGRDPRGVIDRGPGVRAFLRAHTSMIGPCPPKNQAMSRLGRASPTLFLMRLGLVVLLLAPILAAEEEFFPKVGLVDDFPREVRRGKNLIIDGTLVRGYKNPELVLIAPDGRAYLNADNDTTDSEFTFTVHFDHGIGAYKMEIIGHRPSTDRSVARFTVWYGKNKPKDGKYEPPIEEHPPPRTLHERRIEKQFARWLQQLRRKVRVKPANWNEAVAARAREHAALMAEKNRKIHTFGGIGPRELLGKNGAGSSGLSGPATPWTRLSKNRPFPRPRPALPSRDTTNYVVVDVFGCTDPFQKFQEHYLRLPGFRLKAVDPNCTEFAVGVARRPLKQSKKGKRRTHTRAKSQSIYICVVFVQVNDITLTEAQDEFYVDLRKRATKTPTPALMRALGNWSRPKGIRILGRHLGHEKPEIAGAAHDGMMLLDKRQAINSAKAMVRKAQAALQRGQYGTVAALHAPYVYSLYDTEARHRALRTRRDLERTALRELGTILTGPEEGRAKKLRHLYMRCKGLKAQAKIGAALKP